MWYFKYYIKFKVQVEKGAVTQMYIKNEDGSYQIFTKHWKHEEKAVISNGISKSRITVDGEIVNIIFVKSIKPPKKKTDTIKVRMPLANSVLPPRYEIRK